MPPSSGATPLSHASRCGHTPVVALLLTEGKADPDISDFEVWSCRNKVGFWRRQRVTRKGVAFGPLHWAASKGHEDIVRLLLQSGARIMTDCAGRTPISHAAEVGSREIVMILLDSGDEVRLRDSVGRNPLSHAAEAGQQHIVEILLGTDVDVDSPDVVGRTAMSWAAERGQQAVCKRLHARGADVKTKDKYGWTPILWAARGGHSSVLQQILMTNDSTSSPVKNLASAILLAVSGKSRSWRTEYQTPLSWALKNGFNDVADCLLATEIDANLKDEDGVTALIHAVRAELETVVIKMLALGADVRVKDTMNRTLLHLVGDKTPKGIIAALLALNGIDVNAQDDDGETPLMYAAFQGNNAMVASLLSRDDIDANAVDRSGETTLIRATWRGDEETIRTLLTSGKIDVTMKDAKKHPALYHAACRGHGAVVSMLLEKSPEDFNLFTLLVVAAEGKLEATEVLLDKIDSSTAQKCFH